MVSGPRTEPGRASYDVWQAPGTLTNLYKIGRCPSGHRPMFYEPNCYRWEATCFCRSTYCIYIDILLLKTKNINEKIFISLEQVRMIYMKRTSAIEVFAVLSKCGFHHYHCQSQLNFSYFNNLFLGGMMANFDINEFIIARENSC